MLHLNFVSRFVSDNNVVGDSLWMETLRHPEKQILTLTKKKYWFCEGDVKGIDFEGGGVRDIGWQNPLFTESLCHVQPFNICILNALQCNTMQCTAKHIGC